MHPAYGLFETLKVLDGVPFALTRHLRRLESSAQALGIEGYDETQVRDAVSRALASAGPEAMRMRVLWGSGGVEVELTALPPVAASTAVRTSRWRRNEQSAVRGHKTTAYAENLLALAEATRQGCTESLLADTRGMLSEGTGANVFYVMDGELRTPSLATGCLPGVTRALVLEWCGAVEVDEPITVLERANEVFLTSSTRDVQAVRQVDGRQLTAPGPLTREVQETWRERVRTTPDP
ncbi:aminotransferase class IV [Nocardioides gilvus]|uniref:aminotransferase class IV n=1 Tax=Nocardioides gilvus TaxID=1735589 RepID=UPI0013A5872C|nr:aminotransferase class IV [Nocardioides gilvus]